MQSVNTENLDLKGDAATAIKALRMRARGILPSKIMKFLDIDYATYRNWITGGLDDTDAEYEIVIDLTAEIRRLGTSAVAAS
ncbi:hypothetical protein [Glycomyces buryatensis]|uniref:Uncharacterized protein n=1 Tax=Glycomyces buryatensis TaxID=2570927 RepID=A0A4S8Q879_9ACTN|nr:hypothetical protein [Glycomyces buryatensis]THV40587.1 hypothetical protein FAB82_15080 [Glycomyces buryatensis]